LLGIYSGGSPRLAQQTRQSWLPTLCLMGLHFLWPKAEVCPPWQGGPQGVLHEDPLPQKTRRSFLKASIPLARGTNVEAPTPALGRVKAECMHGPRWMNCAVTLSEILNRTQSGTTQPEGLI
jgi:hypothetical protein